MVGWGRIHMGADGKARHQGDIGKKRRLTTWERKCTLIGQGDPKTPCYTTGSKVGSIETGLATQEEVR